MAFLWPLVLVLFAGTVCSKRQSNDIAGGSLANIEQYASLVQIEASYLGWTQMCAGTILNSLYVLTAANCLELHYYGIYSRRIRAGATMRGIGGDIRYVSEITKHPTWNVLNGDIAVIRIFTPFIYSPGVQPTTIINQDGVIPDNSIVVSAGWNTIRSDGIVSYELVHVTVPTVNIDICREGHPFGPRNVTENMICVGIRDFKGEDACQGDIGGPLYFSGIQVGVVSWGYKCAQVHTHGVSTRIASYTNWIVATAV